MSKNRVTHGGIVRVGRSANSTACNIMVHNNFSKIIVNLESDQHIPNTNE